MRREELCKLLAEVEKHGVVPATALVEVRKEKDQTIIDIYQNDIWLEAEVELEEDNIEELIEQLSEQFEEVREAKEPIHISPIK